MSSNNEQEHEEQTTFWKRTLIGIPYWLIALVIIIIIIYWAYKQNFFTSMGMSSSKSNMSFAEQNMLKQPEITPVESRLPFMQQKVQ